MKRIFNRDIIMLVLLAGFLPIGVILVIAILQMQIRIEEQQTYALNQGYEQTLLTVKDKMGRLQNISTLIAVSDTIPMYLSYDKEDDSLSSQLAKFEELDSYSFGMEMAFESSNLYFFVDDGFPVINEYNGRYKSLAGAKSTKWYDILDKNNGKPTWVNYNSDIALTRKLWSTKNYDECVGILALTLDYEDFVDMLIPAIEGEIIYLADSKGNVLAGNEESIFTIPNNAYAIKDTTFRRVAFDGKKYLVRTNYIGKVDSFLVALIPAEAINSKLLQVSLQTTLLYIFIAMIVLALLNPLIGKVLDEQYKLGQEKTGAELKALQSQINPHFLYNTLDMISWMAQKNETDNIKSVVQEMSKFYRLTLSRGQDIVTIADEIKMCNAYMEIQKRRFKGKITYEVEVDDDILKYQIPKITIQPFLENAVIHGIHEKEDGRGIIVLNGWLEDDRITLSVTDDGIGFDKNRIADKSKGSHYGMANIEKRLELFYGEKIHIQVESSENVGTCVILNLPLVEERGANENEI